LTDLPLIYLDAVYHLGAPLQVGGNFRPRGEKLWDFEFGMLSVSLDPEAWRHNWAGPGGVIYEVTTDRQLCLIDADLTLTHARAELERAALAEELVTPNGGQFQPTDKLYACLRLICGSTLPLTGRSFEDQALQAALAVLISLAGADADIDGLWWSDMLGGEMRTERGGIFQHLLHRYQVRVVGAPAPTASPVPVWQPAAII
jgi:hypothetical protein